MKFDEIIIVNGNKLTKKYIESLTKEERMSLIDPIFNVLRANGWIYPDDLKSVRKEYSKLEAYNPDITNPECFNNSSLATNICKYYCHNFYLARNKGKNTMIDNFHDDNILKRIIYNRLGLDWIDDVNESFNLSFKMTIQAQRSMRLINQTSMFKPSIAKYMYLKYSKENDVVFDYSAGWGGRLLGAASCNRQYIGVDPLTTNELIIMANDLGLGHIQLIKDGSENVKLPENSIDFSFSSPPYYDQEYYSDELTQAYNNGEDYFYNIYWRQTLENVKFMLKPNSWFGLNIKNYPKMLEVAKEYFGEVVEEVNLKTVRSHLNKKNIDAVKYESIYMFKNIK